MIQIKGELFEAVQLEEIFSDSKTFVDCVPKMDEDAILSAYREQSGEKDFNLKRFILEHFYLPAQSKDSSDQIDTSSVENYIESLWEVLKRTPKDKKEGDTLIPLAKPYIVPGGRFREIYYWDTYFTSFALALTDRYNMIRDMIENFIHLLETVGFVPNGNRWYYTSRSQPPVLVLMVDLLYQKFGINYIKNYVGAIEKEYKFWMKDAEKLTEKNPAQNHVVRMPDGTVLNRYYDKNSVPREESYREDVNTAKGFDDAAQKQLFQNLRSACESGWDFSSRWLKDKKQLKTIHTLDIVPVDLNSLFYACEKLLSKYFLELNDKKKADFYSSASKKRAKAINQYLWDDNSGYYFDYDWRLKKIKDIIAVSGIVPLFAGLASENQAVLAEKIVRDQLLFKGGVAPTTIETEQQWDKPNGWPPLQWFAVRGFFNYYKNDLAYDIVKRWNVMIETDFKNRRSLKEKYDVVNPEKLAQGGEYGVQEGFGWTNGVTLAFKYILKNKSNSEIVNLFKLSY